MSNKIKSSSKKKNTKKVGEQEAFKEILEYCVAAFAVVLCISIPLYLKDGFSNAGQMKFDAYKAVGGFGLILLALIAIGYWAYRKFKFDDRYSNTDICCGAFLIVCVIGAIAGGNFEDCLTGYQGWYMGIVSQLSFIAIFFMLSRFGRFDKAVLYVLMGACIIVYGTGVLNKMLIDPFGVYYLGTEYQLAPDYLNNFLSTMGQVSWYSGFVATTLPIALGVFWYSDVKNVRIFSGIVSMLGFLTLTSMNSESAFMALAGFMLVFFWFSAKDVNRMERFWELVFMFTLSTRIMKLLFIIHPNEYLQLDAFSEFTINNNLMWIAVVISGAIWASFYFVFKKKNVYNVKVWTILRYVAVGLVTAVFLISAIILILSATGNTPDWLAEITAGNSYLTWNDTWGNYRGRSWTANVVVYRDMDLINKIFGVGPDGYAFYAYTTDISYTLQEMFPGLVLSNAHNEWMNALINHGIIGATAYIGIFVTCIKNFSKFNEKNPLYVAYIACIVSYMAHNFFCYQTVCCTPFIFLFMALGMYLFRKDNEEYLVKEKVESKKAAKSK